MNERSISGSRSAGVPAGVAGEAARIAGVIEWEKEVRS